MFDISVDCPDLLKVNQYTREEKHPLVSMFLIECISEITSLQQRKGRERRRQME